MNGYAIAALVGTALGVLQLARRVESFDINWSGRDIVGGLVDIAFYTVLAVVAYAAYRAIRRIRTKSAQ